MNKKLLISIFALCSFLLLVIGCRQDVFLQNEEKFDANASKFKVVQLKDIPQVVKFVKNKTGRKDLKIQLKNKFSSSSLAKGNIDFANLESSFILKSTEEEVAYYIFNINNAGDEKTIYNFEVKEVGGDIVSAKVLEYLSDVPYEDDPISVLKNFNGTVTAYDLEEKVIATTNFLNGQGPCSPNPPGGGGVNPGYGVPPSGSFPNPGFPSWPSFPSPPSGGGGNSGGENPPTEGCENPNSYVLIGVIDTGNGTGQAIYENDCGWQYTAQVAYISVSTNKLTAPCDDGSGVVLLPGINIPFIKFLNNLSPNLQVVINAPENSEFYALLSDYFFTNGQSQDAKDFITWAIQFINDNPSVTAVEFENWFINPDGSSNLNLESWYVTKTEGMDGNYINNLEDIHSTLNYQTRQMPNYSQFVNAFPKINYPDYPGYFKQMSAAQVYNIVGDPLKSLYLSTGGDNGQYRNACTIRWSLAMNKLGIFIPQNSLSLQGANVNGQPWYYYIRASTAGDSMHKIFGSPTHKLEGSAANDNITVLNFLKGKTGIYVIVNANPSAAGYTGHVDLIQNGHIPGGSNHTNVPGGIKYIAIWEFTP